MRADYSRRLFLRGAGSVLVALPLCPELLPRSSVAQQNAVPQRLLTMFFGLGIEGALQAEGFEGPLHPLKDIAPKAAMFSDLNTDGLHSDEPRNHLNVGAGMFTGRKQIGYDRSGGPSLEQLMKNSLHPDGVPSATGLPSLSAGFWSRTGGIAQFTRSWNADGSAGPRPERRPSRVFDMLFGEFVQPPASPLDPAEAARFEVERRVKRSILDSVIEQHETLLGPRSLLGQESKARVGQHLQNNRDVERELIPGDAAARAMEATECSLPDKAGFTDPEEYSFYDEEQGPQTGPIVHHEVASKAFNLIGDLFVLGLACDALRFGSLLFFGCGEHIRLDGEYEATGIGRRWDFGDSFGRRSVHDAIFHSYNRDAVRVYQYYALSHHARTLGKMNAITEPNGKTLLDNTLTVLNTEYGKNHDGSKDVFGAVIGGNGKFRPGKYDDSFSLIDFYGTIMRAYGIDSIGGRDIPGVVF